MRGFKVLLCTVACLAVVLPALAQIPSGTLTGRVTDGREALPGVTVEVDSPALQGRMSTVTAVNGDYVFRFLPPGSYTVTFTIDGFHSEEAAVRINAAQTMVLDGVMTPSTMTQEITVTGAYETISSGSHVATTFQSDMIEKLPVGRTLNAAALLAPGVTSTGPSNYITISGAMSYENLFMVNGVVTQDNIRNTPLTLYIEDAIQETTVSTAGISAEFGRFSGGVVNLLTKSGGNQFSGSARLSLTNDKWTAETPLTTAERKDDLNQTLELTFGGYVMRDRLWFFLAGRDVGLDESRETALTAVAYSYGDDERRYEGKLTFSATPSHRLVGSYMEVEREQAGYGFGTVMDLRSVYTRELPQELLTVNYTGILSDNFFVEGAYSEREFKFVGSGSPWTDLIDGTLLVQRVGGRRWWSPTFCGPCGDEERSNEAYSAKGSYFLSTATAGTHDLVAGYEHYNDVRLVDNHQSGSDFRVYLGSIIDGSNVWSFLDPTADHYIMWNPIFVKSRGTAFKTDSLYVNDRWRLNKSLSFNIGLRYDKNDGVNAQGDKVSDDSNLSPRLSATYDVKADGEWIVNASYARYVMGLANNQADASSAGGSPASFGWTYTGPAINTGGPPYLTTDEVLRQMWAWFDSQGGTDNSNYRFASIPGANRQIPQSLESPYTDEFVIGVNKRFGSKGQLRLDLVRRDYGGFYVERIDQSTGLYTMPNGSIVDLGYIENDSADLLEREYLAVQVSGQYRPFDRLQIQGNYTWSNAEGNWDGETGPNGPVRSALYSYPEYRSFARHNPSGDLAIDQRHKLKVWAMYDIVKSGRHSLTASLMHSFWSGTPYQAAAGINTRPFVDNPGYRTPPSTVTYYFTDRGAFTTDDIQSTDLSLSYSLILPGSVELFIQPQVTNIFNNDDVTSVNTSVFTNATRSSLQAFNPWTETPVEGTHWEKGADFGKPTVPGSYQQPRTFRISLGLRF